MVIKFDKKDFLNDFGAGICYGFFVLFCLYVLGFGLFNGGKYVWSGVACFSGDINACSSEVQIKRMGYRYEDVRVFVKFMKLSKNDFVRSRGLRQDYELWRKGRLFCLDYMIEEYGCSKNVIQNFFLNRRIKRVDYEKSVSLKGFRDLWGRRCGIVF